MKNKQETFYCGFIDGRPHISIFNDGFIDVGTASILFRKKKEAKMCFIDVRKVKIVEVK